MRTLILYRDGGSWMCEHVNDAHVRSLFGATAIPTCFTDRATASVVRAEIERLNPEAQVLTASDRSAVDAILRVSR